jgi:hypothetical protein
MKEVQNGQANTAKEHGATAKCAGSGVEKAMFAPTQSHGKETLGGRGILETIKPKSGDEY